MAISTVNDLLTETRKLVLQVGVKSDSTYTLQGALDYFLVQVNTLQSENPDIEVVAKMLDRRTSQMAIDEGAGRGNVYDIYSDAYVSKYSLGSSFSLAIDKVGIDSIGDKVNASIQSKIDDGSIGAGSSDIVTEFDVTTLDVFGSFKLEYADLTYNGMTGHHSINNTFGGLVPSISGVTYYSAADNDGSNSIYIIYDTNVNDYNSVTMHFNDSLLATITTSELGVYGFMIPNTVTGTGTLAIKNNDVVLHSEEVTITDGVIPFSGTKTTPVKTYVDNVGATIPTDADINNLIELAIQSKIDRGLLAEAEVSIVGSNISGLLFSLYTKGKYAPTEFTDGSVYNLGGSGEDNPVMIVEYADTGLGWNAYQFSFVEYTGSTQPYNAGIYLIIPINPSTDFSNPVSLTISNIYGDFLADGANISINLESKSIVIM